MREHADFAYFHADATAKLVINTGYVGNYTIDSQTIVFADDSGKIYTHGGEFGGKQTTINKGEGILVSKSGSEYTLSLDTDWLTLNFKPTSTTVQNPYTLPIASSSILGGIKTGYTTNDKNYKVLVDSNGNAFVNVPWSSSSNSDGGSSSGVTKEYVDGKIEEQKQRLNDIINNDIHWNELLEEYLSKTEDNGFDITVKGIITEWVKNDTNRSLVWLQLNAASEKPSWVSVVTQLVGNDIQGTQINQKVQLLSALVGHFDENGNPKAEDFAGIIISGNVPDTENPGHTKRVIDLISDEVVASGKIITPEVISTIISTDGITVGGDGAGVMKMGTSEANAAGKKHPYIWMKNSDDDSILYLGGDPNRPSDLYSSRNAIYSSGAGHLAGGNISWTDQGKLTINGAQSVIIGTGGQDVNLPSNASDGAMTILIVKNVTSSSKFVLRTQSPDKLVAFGTSGFGPELGSAEFASEGFHMLIKVDNIWYAKKI